MTGDVAAPRSPRRRGRRVAFAVGVAVAFAGSLELAARLVLPRTAIPVLFSPLDGAVSSTVPEFFRAHPTLLWELVPNVTRSAPTFWGDVVDADGLRMRRDVGAKDGRLRVACFGDSCTYGLGVPVDDAWPSVLGSDATLDVINAGVPGYTTYQGALMADMRCPSWNPDVVVVEYGINDPLAWMQYDRGRVVAPTDVERAPHVRIDALVKRSVLIGWLASLTGVPRPKAVASSVLANPADGATTGGVEQREFAAASEALKNDAERLPARVPPDQYRANLARIAAHAPYAIVLQWPRRRLLDPATRDAMSVERLAPYVEATAAAATDRVDVIDLAPLLFASHLTADQAFLDTVHGRRALSDLVAAAVREKIRARLKR
jgi:lysophospholipase L1-like esterase